MSHGRRRLGLSPCLQRPAEPGRDDWPRWTPYLAPAHITRRRLAVDRRGCQRSVQILSPACSASTTNMMHTES